MTDDERANPNEARIETILKPFGWKCGDEFWRRYYTDSWVFNLVNAIERLADAAVGVGDVSHQPATEYEQVGAWLRPESYGADYDHFTETRCPTAPPHTMALYAKTEDIEAFRERAGG